MRVVASARPRQRDDHRFRHQQEPGQLIGDRPGRRDLSENSLLSLTNCTVNANQANGATALGGGIYALDCTVDVQSCTVDGNQANGTVLGEGGGIYSAGSVLTLVASTAKGNKATTGGDDIFGHP